MQYYNVSMLGLCNVFVIFVWVSTTEAKYVAAAMAAKEAV